MGIADPDLEPSGEADLGLDLPTVKKPLISDSTLRKHIEALLVRTANKVRNDCKTNSKKTREMLARKMRKTRQLSRQIRRLCLTRQ